MQLFKKQQKSCAKTYKMLTISNCTAWNCKLASTGKYPACENISKKHFDSQNGDTDN